MEPVKLYFAALAVMNDTGWKQTRDVLDERRKAVRTEIHEGLRALEPALGIGFKPEDWK